MPHKYNAARRHHTARPKRRVTNWSAYNEALRQRGSLTVWFTEDAIAAWKAAPRTTPGGQPHYSGTLFGGWRIVKTMGSKITNLKPMQGFCAETGGAITLFLEIGRASCRERV